MIIPRPSVLVGFAFTCCSPGLVHPPATSFTHTYGTSLIFFIPLTTIHLFFLQIFLQNRQTYELNVTIGITIYIFYLR
jgi:hypothetical protein